MHPILFQIGNITIYSYGLFMALGILSAIFCITKLAKKRGYNEDHILNFCIITVVGGILGGKIMFIIVELPNIIKDTSILLDFGNGFVVYGALIGGALSAIFYAKKKGWNIWSILDILVPAVAIGQGFGRIGCFMAGCCYGAPTNLTIGVDFKNSPYAPHGVHVHPTQIYSSVFDFLLAIFLLRLLSKNKKEGTVGIAYIIIYSVGRFFVEFLRNDPRGHVSILSTSQFISIFTFIIGILMLNKDKFKKQKVEKYEE